MHTRITRVLAGAAVVAVAAVGLFSTSASALPPGSASSGLVSVVPGTGSATTVLAINPPVGAACQGDSATGGYRWQTFITAASVDAGTLTYTGGAGPNPVGTAVVSALVSNTGSVITDQTTSVGTNLVTGVPSFDFSAFPAGFFPNGVYNVGFACTLSNATTRFWQSPITVTNTGGVFAFSFGAAPTAPVLNSPLTSGNGTLAGTFTQAASAPAVTGYTVTAVPTVGATVTLPLAAAATSFTLTGLTNGTSYAVSLKSTNTAGTSVASNTVSGTPAVAAQPPVTNLAAAPAPLSAILSWTPPTGPPALTGYTIGVSPTVAGAPFTIVGAASTFTVTGLAAGTVYTFTVTATYAAPDSGTPATVQLAPPGNSLITQDILVTRPIGDLVLTQRCGVYGALPADAASAGFAAFLGLPASVDQIGIAPTIDAARTIADPKFGQYPYPTDANEVPNPTYPTHCGLQMGISKLVKSGPEAGKYFAIDGRLNQVTVADTRDADTGWSLSGSASNFTSGLNSFSGNYLGWMPVATSTSGVTFDGYDQLTTAGAVSLPAGTAGPGLGTSKVLGSAAANVGLGIASFDAHLKLLIPVTANAGVYQSILTLTVA
jgi:hypothetical protein